jgi:hypothetical protein
MGLSLVVQVPVADQEDLRQLVESSPSSGRIIQSRPFDGETVVQALLLLSPATYPFFRTWITSRTEKAKNTFVSIDGMRLKGFTPKEVLRITEEIERRLKNDDSDLGG